MSARTTGARWRNGLIGLLVVSSACNPPPPPVLTPDRPTHYVIGPGVPDEDVVCVVIPNELPYDAELVGVHCMTVHDLRRWFGRQRKAE